MEITIRLLSARGTSWGSLNSVTDQLYGKDAKTGYYWGVAALNEQDTKAEPGSAAFADPDDKGVYTKYQKALSNSAADVTDGKPKEASFRYADSQDTAGINPRCVFYKFELDPGKYDVTVGMSNTWGNAGNPVVRLSADGIDEIVSDSYSSGSKTLSVDLTQAETNDNGKVELSVKGTTTGATLQMTYITITEPANDAGVDYFILPPRRREGAGR